jgi:hypothetical protein
MLGFGTPDPEGAMIDRLYYLVVDALATACLLVLAPQIVHGQLDVALAVPFSLALAGAYALSRLPAQFRLDPRLLAALLTEPGRHGSALGYVWFLSLSLAMPSMLGYAIGAALRLA